MRLWQEWFQAVGALRPACTRWRTYAWMVVVLLGLSIRSDLAGVTSVVRVLGLPPRAYRRLLHLVHSPALRLDPLTALWTRWCRDALPAFTVGAARVCLADGLKAPKEGRKMPAVKKLHQESPNNSKPPFIFGHSFQCVSLLTRTAAGHAAAVPLAARICEGVVWSNRDRRTQLDRLVLLFRSLATALEAAVVLVADAYYASRKVILPLLADGHHLAHAPTPWRTNPSPARLGHVAAGRASTARACAYATSSPTPPHSRRSRAPSTGSATSRSAIAASICSGAPSGAASALSSSATRPTARSSSCRATSPWTRSM